MAIFDGFVALDALPLAGAESPVSLSCAMPPAAVGFGMIARMDEGFGTGN